MYHPPLGNSSVLRNCFLLQTQLYTIHLSYLLHLLMQPKNIHTFQTYSDKYSHSQKFSLIMYTMHTVKNILTKLSKCLIYEMVCLVLYDMSYGCHAISVHLNSHLILSDFSRNAHARTRSSTILMLRLFYITLFPSIF